MIAFVIPLRSKITCKNWALISKLCLRTLHSLLQQTASDYKVFLACNEPPENLPTSEKLVVISRNFPIPEIKPGRLQYDKLCKICHGLIEARRFNPNHFMLVDADDCVSRHLVEYVSQNPNCDGWIMDVGWIHNENSSWLLWQRTGFHKICGSSVIAPFNFECLPNSVDEDFNPYRPFLEHNRMFSGWSEAGKLLRPLPFPGAIYNLGTGENVSRFHPHPVSFRNYSKIILKKMLFSRPLTSKLRGEFGLTKIT